MLFEVNVLKKVTGTAPFRCRVDRVSFSHFPLVFQESQILRGVETGNMVFAST